MLLSVKSRLTRLQALPKLSPHLACVLTSVIEHYQDQHQESEVFTTLAVAALESENAGHPGGDGIQITTRYQLPPQVQVLATTRICLQPVPGPRPDCSAHTHIYSLQPPWYPVPNSYLDDISTQIHSLFTRSVL